MKIKRIIAIIITSTFLSMFPGMAYSANQPDKLINTEKQSQSIITKTITENNEKIEINARIPEIKGLSSFEFEKEINLLINRTYEKDRTALFEASKQLQIPGNKSVLFVTNEIKTDNENLLSFAITSYLYSGGANGMTRVDYYNIDKKRNRLLALEDLFSAGSDYKTIINSEIKRQINEALKTDLGIYFSDNDYAFKTIRNDQGFYIKDGNLVIGFAKYEIAPGASGTPEFEIPIDKFGEIFVFDCGDQVSKDNQDIVKVNGYKVQYYINNPKDKVIMVKLRDLAKYLIYDLTWDNSNNSIEFKKGNETYSIKIGENNYVYNKTKAISLECAPEIKDGYTFVPVGFAEQLLKAVIEKPESITT